MMSWVIKLSQFDIHYERHITIKAQVFTNFTLETTDSTNNLNLPTWTMHVDGSSNTKGSGAGVVLESDTGLILEQSLHFEFIACNT